MTPADANLCRHMLYSGYKLDTPAVVRYPRGSGVDVPIDTDMQDIPIGKAKIMRQGKNIALLAFGPMLHSALNIAEHFDATVVDMRFVKPLDTDCFDLLAQTHTQLVTLEDNVTAGGAGSAVLEYLASTGQSKPTLLIGYPDHFIAQGTPDQVYDALALSPEKIKGRIEAFMLKHREAEMA